MEKQTKKENSNTKTKKNNYSRTFLKKKDLKSRQPVYISKTIHQSVTKLVHLLALSGKEISVGVYIDNILTEHLKQNKEEIAELCRKQMDSFL